MSPSHWPTRMRGSRGRSYHEIRNISRVIRCRSPDDDFPNLRKGEHTPEYCSKLSGDGERDTARRFSNLVCGLARRIAYAWGPLRKKRAEIHRGSRRRCIGPLREAGYTSAIVTVEPKPTRPLQSGGVHIHPHMPCNATPDCCTCSPLSGRSSR